MFPDVFYVIALILGLIELAQARLRSLIAFAVVFVCIGLLWGRLT